MAGEGHSNPTLLSPTPDGWSVAAIEDLCENVTSGGTPLRSDSSYYQGGIHSWFRTQELKDSILFESEEKITDKALAQTSAKLFPKNTVLMAMYGDGKTITSLGILAKEAATNQACCAMIPDRVHCEPRFLFYALKHHREDFIRIASGGAQRNLSGKLIRRFAINTPPLDEQRAIAHILGTLDDKIELNRRMKETLEAVARALFKSWFVDFEPVRAKAEGRDPGLPKPLTDLFPGSFEDSELGEIPNGWDLAQLGTLVDFVKGKKPAHAATSMADGLSPVILIEGFEGKVSAYASAIGMVEVMADDVLMVMDGASSGRVETGCTGLVGSTLARITPRGRLPGKRFLYFLLKHLEPSTRHHLTGTSIPHADKGWVAHQAVCFPKAPGLLNRFENLAAHLRGKVDAARRESLSLAVLRDTLLPKLISGELRVPDADQFARGREQ